MSDQPPTFEPGESAILREALQYCERGVSAPAGATVEILFAWTMKGNAPGYRIRYRQPGSTRELHVVVPASALAKVDETEAR